MVSVMRNTTEELARTCYAHAAEHALTANKAARIAVDLDRAAAWGFTGLAPLGGA